MNTDELPTIFSIACPIKDKYEAIDRWLEIIVLKKGTKGEKNHA